MPVRRWLVRAALAAGVTWAVVYVITPPRFVWHQLEAYPGRTIGQLTAVFAVVLVLVVLGDMLVTWATRRPRRLRTSAVVSFVTGLLSGLFTLSLWFAFLSLPVAPIGIAAAWLALRRETAAGEGHSLMNLVGLILNLLALGVVASQVISATVWR